MIAPSAMGQRHHRSSPGLVLWALLVLPLALAVRGSAQPAQTVMGTLVLPGGAAAARKALDLGDPDGRLPSTMLLEFVRRFANVDMATASKRLERHLLAQAQGESDSALPLPLPGFWRDTFGEASDLLFSLIRDRNALLTYHGLMALDEATLATLANHPALMRSILKGRVAAAAFAVSSDGLRADTDGVHTPGGAEHAAAWETLVGASADDVDAFLSSLFTRDGGRLAWFYGAVAGLPEATQQFVLASAEPGDRIATLRSIYAHFRSVDENWRLTERPFYRPPFDGALMLMLTPVVDARTVGPSWWPAALDDLTGSGSWDLGQDVVDGRTNRPADAHWLFDWVFAEPGEAHRRFGALRLAQRLFADTSPAAAADVRAAIGGALATPVLMFTLERLGVRDPAVLAAAARAARASTDAGGQSRVVPALARWQAALGLLEQVQRRVGLPEPQITALVRSLTAVSPAVRREPAAVAGWIVDELLGTLIPGRPAYSAIEDAFLRAATRPVSTDATGFVWEGLPYVVDLPGVTWQSATAIRRARRGPQLQDLVELLEVHRTLASPDRGTNSANIAARLEGVRAVIEDLDDGGDDRVRALAGMLETMRGRAAGTTASPAVAADAVDALTDLVVPALLYALAVSPTTEPILYPEAWTRHSLQEPTAGPFAARQPWREVLWQFPTDYGLGGGTRLIGAMLGVDLALADSRLVRLVSPTLPAPGVIDDPMRRGVVERLVLQDVPLADALPPTALDDLAEGRRIADRWRAGIDDASLRRALREAGIDAWRINALAWELAHGNAQALDTLSLAELVSLAAGGEARRADWSGSSRLADGCFCLTTARHVTREQMRGRRLGLQALQPLDVALRVAELLNELGLDTSLVPVLMPPALQDWLDRSHPAWSDDWEAYTQWPSRLSIERVEEYLLFLVSAGVFSPPPQTESTG